MSTPNYISIGSGNSLSTTTNPTDVFILGNGITADNSNELYLDSSIYSISASGMVNNASTNPAKYGLYNDTTTSSLFLAPITDQSISAATPTTLGTVYGLVDNGSTPTGNTGLGLNVLADNTGTNNTVVGENAFKTNTVGSNNTIMGYQALAAVNATTATNASDNVCIGNSLTSTVTDASGITVVGSSNNSPSVTTLSNALVVGYNNAIGTGSLGIIGNNNTVSSSSSVVIGSNNKVTQSPNALIFANSFIDSTPLPSGAGTGTLYFDPNLNNIHISPSIPSSTNIPSTDTGVPLLLDNTTGYLYQSSVPLAYPYAYYNIYSASPASDSITNTPSTVIYTNSINDNTGLYSTSTGEFTATAKGTYRYKYQLAVASDSLANAGTSITFSVVTSTPSATAGDPPTTSTIQSTVTELPLINFSTPLYAPIVTLVGAITLNAGESLYSTIAAPSATSTSPISVILNNSYMKITAQ